MDRYAKKKIQLTIILFLLFFIVLLIVSILSTSQRRGEGSSTIISTTKEERRHKEDVVATLPKITDETVKTNIKLDVKVKIKDRASIDHWVIVTIVPENKATDPGLIIYQRSEYGYVKVIGPGTSFTVQQMKSASIPDIVIYHPITKRFLSGRS